MTDLHRNAVVAEKIPACDRPLIIQGPDAGVYVPGMEGPAGMPLVTEALLRRGLPEATIRKVLGENLIRVLSKE
jgi:membrane dipeptidase